MDIHPSLVCKGGCIGSGGPRGLGAPRGVGMLPFLPTCFLSPPCHSSHSIFHFGKWIKPPKCVVGSRQDLQKALGGTGSLLGWCVCVCTGEYHPRILLYFCWTRRPSPWAKPFSVEEPVACFFFPLPTLLLLSREHGLEVPQEHINLPWVAQEVLAFHIPLWLTPTVPEVSPLFLAPNLSSALHPVLLGCFVKGRA